MSRLQAGWTPAASEAEVIQYAAVQFIPVLNAGGCGSGNHGCLSQCKCDRCCGIDRAWQPSRAGVSRVPIGHHKLTVDGVARLKLESARCKERSQCVSRWIPSGVVARSLGPVAVSRLRESRDKAVQYIVRQLWSRWMIQQSTKGCDAVVEAIAHFVRQVSRLASCPTAVVR